MWHWEKAFSDIFVCLKAKGCRVVADLAIEPRLTSVGRGTKKAPAGISKRDADFARPPCDFEMCPGLAICGDNITKL